MFDTSSNKNSVLSDNLYLTFDSSEPEDAGEYKCIARNEAGNAEAIFKVQVFGKYQILSFR